MWSCVLVGSFSCRDLPGSAGKVTVELETLKPKGIAGFMVNSKLGNPLIICY